VVTLYTGSEKNDGAALRRGCRLFYCLPVSFNGLLHPTLEPGNFDLLPFDGGKRAPRSAIHYGRADTDFGV
jgi:hypothetical protein